MTEASVSKEFVEELPRPPAYFRLVQADTVPPPIPLNAKQLAQTIYGNHCSTRHLPLYQDNDALELVLSNEPKEVLKR